ncbi:hypothetical protein [Pseudomonas chlororaphis]|uniref:Uncharacterized protein n=1 Tax=Pseudomonas chlororaphis O6 TaxID=1037915 RepID=A0AB33WRF6_9PSED|nr:hypothetical protein [Pseudomonas chlororaphis]EIM15723.1 hypothetical protein PchlO6_3086 [Pseudomonas chlororaphis O6]
MLKAGFYTLLALLSLAPGAQAGSMQWSSIRDGSLYLRADQPDRLKIGWSPAWQSDANREQLYLLQPGGQLFKQLEIRADQAYGEQDIELPAATGDYRLQIPGYSFRGFRVSHRGSTAAQFEPTKVHFSAEVHSGAELFFRVAAGEQAILAGKYYGGVSVLQASRLSDGAKVRLELKEHPAYGQFDQVALPPAEQDQVWRLALGGSGKAAFWLDGTANLFAQEVQQLHPLDQPRGEARLQLKAQILGTTPRLGIALPYAQPPQSTFGLLQAIGARAANFYSFVDVIEQEPEREIGFRRLYRERFGIDRDITLLAGTGRRAVLAADAQSFAGLDAWLADSVRLAGNGLHYLAFADEPNLNYPDYSSYALYFEQMLARAKANPEARAAGVRIAMPASSRLLDGPFRVGAGQRRGIDWARQLLERHGQDIDALAWHEWMVRDLLATRRYRDSVRAAAELVGLDAAGRPRKALLLSQTNISSGRDLSPYQQDTHYAGLWWASVVINASADGLLDMLNWFQAADEPDYPKGMLAQRSANQFSLKPVAVAQQFIARHWLAHVQALDNPAFEVDALAMSEAGRHSLLGVNKASRVQAVSLDGPGDLCQAAPLKLSLLGPDDQPRDAAVECRDGRVHFELPGETLFALTWKAL